MVEIVGKDTNKRINLFIGDVLTEDFELYQAFKYLVENTQRAITKDQIRKALERALTEVA